MESIYLAALGDLIDRPGIFWFTTTGTFPFAFVMSSQKTACPCSLISLSLSLFSLAIRTGITATTVSTNYGPYTAV